MPRALKATNQQTSLYVVENVKNGKLYVGITVRPIEDRWRTHVERAKKGSKLALHSAIMKHGDNAFCLRLVDTFDTWTEACHAECAMIKKLSTNTSGYNMTLGGDGVVGYNHTIDTRVRISRKLKGRTLSISTRQRLSVAQPNKRCVEQRTLEGTLVATFPSVGTATRATRVTNIVKCCRGELKTAGGYMWTYVAMETN